MSRRHLSAAQRFLPGIVCLAFAAAASAAEEPPPWSGAAELGASHATPSAGPDGTLAVDEYFFETRGYWQPRRGIRLGLGVGGGFQRYNGEPVDTRAQSVWLRLPATVMWSEHWGSTSLSSIGSSTAENVPVAEGRRWQVEAGLLWVRDADLLVSLLAVVNSRLERGPRTFPLVSLYWRIDDTWSLTVIDELDNISRLTRTFDNAWAASLLVDARFYEFALDDGDRGPAVLDDDRAIVGIEGAWRPWRDEQLALRPFVGVVVARHITLLDEDGNQVSSSWQSPSVIAGLSLRAAF